MKSILLLSTALVCISMPALADSEFSTTIGFVSEYSFRAIAQSNEEPAIQGSIDWSDDSGLYAGIWGSNVEFGDASLETDLYAGYSGEVDGFTYDIGGIYYAYPGTDDDADYDFFEISLAGGYDFDVAALSLSANYSFDYFGGSGDALYTAANLDIPLPFLPFDATLNTNIGHQTIDDRVAFGAPDYTDWGVGLSIAVEGFDISAKYIDTNLSRNECADGCSERVILSISRSFP